MAKQNQPSAVDPLAAYPSVGRILHVPVDEKPGPAGNPSQFSRPPLVSSVGDHQSVNGSITLERGDTFKGNSGPGVFVVENVANWHWPNTQQPYAGR